MSIVKLKQLLKFITKHVDKVFSKTKNNGKELDQTVVFGTKNARYYVPVIRDAYVKDGRLFVILLRRTTKWGKVYHWEVIAK